MKDFSAFYRLGKERQWELFLNHLYFFIDRSISVIDQLIENPNEVDRLEEQIKLLERNLLEADAIVRYCRLFLDDDLYPGDFFRGASDLLYGVTMTGIVNAELHPIGEEGRLSEADISILNTIRGNLDYAKQEMYSEETNQENPNITRAEINEIILNHLNDTPSGIYKETFK